jgi:hypothetical protein
MEKKSVDKLCYVTLSLYIVGMLSKSLSPGAGDCVRQSRWGQKSLLSEPQLQSAGVMGWYKPLRTEGYVGDSREEDT